MKSAKKMRDIRAGRRRRKAIFLFTVSILVLSALGYSAFEISKSSLFIVKSIEVKGVARIEPERVVALSGIRRGVNILEIDVESARKSIRTDPWIASADIIRRYPDRVELRITERSPVARMPYAASDHRLIDRRGFVVAAVGPTQAVDLPILAVAKVIPNEPGEQMKQGAVGAALEVVGQVDARIMREVATVSASSSFDVRLELENRTVILWGDDAQPREKNRAALAILAEAKRKKVTFGRIDVRVPENPVSSQVSRRGG